MVKDHSDSKREETCCRHIGYSFQIAARVLLYASSHRQDNTYHTLCYTSRGALTGTRNSSMGPPHEGSIRRPIAPLANALTTNRLRVKFKFMSQNTPISDLLRVRQHCMGQKTPWWDLFWVKWHCLVPQYPNLYLLRVMWNDMAPKTHHHLIWWDWSGIA